MAAVSVAKRVVGVLNCVAVRCRALQCVAVPRLRHVEAVSVAKRVAGVSQCVAVCGSSVCCETCCKRVAVCGSV